MGQNKLKVSFINKVYTTFSSLKHLDFRYFWLGQCISWIGTWMQRTAQVWLIYTLTESPFILGLLGFFQFIPMLVFSLPAGVLVDRFSKKKIIFYSQIGFMLQSFSLAFLVWSGKTEYWHVLLLTAVFGSLQTIDGPARQSWFIDMVGKADLPNAISLNSTITQMAKFLGPMAAGLVMAKYGIAFCFFLNGVSYVAVLFVLFLIKDQGEPKLKESKNIAAEIGEGIIHITGGIHLRITILVMAVFCTFAMNTSVIIPVFADKVLLRGVNGYTGLLSVTGIGAFIGAIYMANRAEAVKCKQLVIDTIIIAIIHIAIAYTRNYYLCLVQMFLIGFFSITFLNMANSTLQMNTEDIYRGRVMSIYTLVNQGSHPLGNIFVGSVMEYSGAAMGFVSCGMLILGLIGILFIKAPMKEYILCGDSSPSGTLVKKKTQVDISIKRNF